MRSIHVIIPAEKESIVTSVLENLNVPFEKIASDSTVMLILTVADEHVETVIDSIRKIGVGTLYGTYQVYNIEFAARAAELPITLKTKRVSREEILSDIWSQAELNRNFILASILASILATLGLLTDNIIITIASMIIAPYFGPILGTSLGIVLNIDELRRESLKSEFIGLGLSVLTGFGFAMVLPYTGPTHRILAISNPTYIDIIFAVVAGIAAAISVISVAPVALVGVAIAASIVPPAVNVGIGLSFALRGDPLAGSIIYGSALLLTINVLAINSMSIVFFWLVGIKPGESIRKELMAKKATRQKLLAIVIAFLVVSAPITFATITHYQEKRIENEIKNSVISYINTHYPGIEIIDITVIYVKTENMTYIYLTIGASKMDERTFNIASDIKSYITRTYHVQVKVYLTISITASTTI